MPNQELTDLLHQATGGGPAATDRLFQELYRDLRRLAASYLRGERREHTLQPTALVHEAYLRLIDQTRVDWRNKSHFFAVAAQAMRRLLIDHARRRGRAKRGGDVVLVTIDDAAGGPDGADRAIDVLAIDEALRRLEREQPEKARLVELRFFGGLTSEEAAEVMGLSLRTVERYWLHARTWIFRELHGSTATSPS